MSETTDELRARVLALADEMEREANDHQRRAAAYLEAGLNLTAGTVSDRGFDRDLAARRIRAVVQDDQP